MYAAIFLLSVFCCPFISSADEVTELHVETTHKPSECSREAKRGDMLSMHYRGTLLDGTVFDSR